MTDIITLLSATIVTASKMVAITIRDSIIPRFCGSLQLNTLLS